MDGSATLSPPSAPKRPGFGAGAPYDRLERPLRDLRISVMDRCNFRCRYCMPEDAYPDGFTFLSPKERLSFDHMALVAKAAARLGVRKVRITGGEPLLRLHLADLVRRIKAIEGIDDIAVTTNGVLLPRQVEGLKKAGLSRVSISLDALDNDVFRRMNGGKGDVDAVLEGIESARRMGLPGRIKVNTVVQRGVNDDQALKICEYFRYKDVSVRFIEYMDVGNRNGWQESQVVPSRELARRIGGKWPLTPKAAVVRGEVASRYAYADGGGEIGFISPVSAPFCGDCTRLRLSSDGKLYTCLFARFGHDVRPVLARDLPDAEKEALLAQDLAGLWNRRGDRYSQERTAIPARREIRVEHAQGVNANVRIARKPGKRIEMNYIGG